MRFRMELFVKDVRASARFYSEVLGFVSGEESDDYMSVRNGDASIGLGAIENLPDGHYLKPQSNQERKGGGVEIVLEVEGIEACYRSIMELGYPVHGALARRPWGATDFRIVDPDGYYIRLTEKR